MKLPVVIASDLHLTANPRDEYRWGLFPWLAEQCKEERARTCLLLGDITDSKDYHPAQLVNRLVESIVKLRESVPNVIIVRGNHDYLKDGHTFFEFLGALPGVRVVTKPSDDDDVDGPMCYFLPHSHHPARDWEGLDFSMYHYLFMHQTVKGAKSSNGMLMEGQELPKLNAVKVYSGDIHVPQIVSTQSGEVEYIGSPYHVHFGDHFTPRCVVIDRANKAHDLHYPAPSRVMMAVSGDKVPLDLLFLTPGDHVKVRVTLAERDKHRWKEVRAEHERMCKEAGVLLQGIELRVERSTERTVPGDKPASLFDPAEAVYSYVESDALGGELLDVGLECVEESERAT